MVINMTGRINLRGQLMIAYLIISVFIVLCMAAVSYSAISGTIAGQSEELILKSFSQVEYNINTILSETETLSKALTVNPVLQLYMEPGPVSESDKVERTRELLNLYRATMSNYRSLDSIFLFRNGGEYLGASRAKMWKNQVNMPEHPFYSGAAYERGVDNYPRILWLGETWEQNPLYTDKASDFVDVPGILAIRNIRWLYGANTKAVLVLRLREDTVHAVYNRLVDYPESAIRIVGTDGVILSSGDKSEIGTGVSWGMDNVTGLAGSFRTAANGVDSKVIYHTMERTGWTITIELPTNMVHGNAAGIVKLIVIIFVCSLGLIILFYTLWIYRSTAPLQRLVTAMGEMEQGNLDVRVTQVPKNEVGFLINRFNSMAASIQELDMENRERQQRERELEIKNLQSQINPHFLHNTLNTIKWMALVRGADNIAGCITALGGLLSPVFRQSGEQHTLAEEILYLRNYFVIMDYRVGGNIRFAIDVPNNALDCKIIRFVLQPLVENAIIHGFPASRRGEVHVGAAVDEKTLAITIADTGVGIGDEQLAAIRAALAAGDAEVDGHIGICNVNRRLVYRYGPEWGVRLGRVNGGGTVTTVNIPKIL